MLYNLESDMEDAIGEEIPVKTEKQLLKIGSGEKVEVDGVEYFYNSGRKYVLENNIETNIEYEKIAEKVKNKEVTIKGNGKQIIVTREDGKKAYYTEDSKFYIAVNKYGYVLDGLELYYDKIDNSGEGKHDNNTLVWKDLSGKNHDGTLMNMDIGNSWSEEGLNFDGVDDYVPIAEMNYENVTLEVIVMPKEYREESMALVCNLESGGYQLYCTSGSKFNFSTYISEIGDYVRGITGFQTEYGLGKKYYISGSYDNKKIKLRTTNSTLTYQENDIVGTIGKPKNNELITLGANPSMVAEEENLDNGEISSVRVYSKTLSDEERSVNYLADKERYNL